MIPKVKSLEKSKDLNLWSFQVVLAQFNLEFTELFCFTSLCFSHSRVFLSFSSICYNHDIN